MKASENRTNDLWPVGTTVDFLDAWGFNPVRGKVIAHYTNGLNVLVEDGRGIRHFGQTWRITTPPPAVGMFDDLLGNYEPVRPAARYDFEDLLS